jgi:hypothetical protein
MAGRIKDSDLDVTPAVPKFPERRRGRPSKVVDVLSVVPIRRLPRRLVSTADLLARRSDDEVSGDPNLHVVDAEVGVKFAVGMKGVTVPPPFLQDADLRKPLGDHEKRTGVPGPGDDAGQTGLKCVFQTDFLAGLHRSGEGDPQDGPIGIIRKGQVPSVDRPDGPKLDPSPGFRLFREPGPTQGAATFPHEQGVPVPEGVHVHVEAQLIYRPAGRVSPPQPRPTRDGPVGRPELCPKLIMYDPVASRLREPGPAAVGGGHSQDEPETGP